MDTHEPGTTDFPRQQARPVRIGTLGPYLMEGARRFQVQGLTYGPFPPESSRHHDGYPDEARIAQDLELITGVGANLLRVYTPPPRRLRAACAERGLRLLVGVPWAQHLDFLEDAAHFEKARDELCRLLDELRGDPLILGLVIANEIPPDMVRWGGLRRVREFLENLVTAGRRHDPAALFTYAAYPPTEYLVPRNLDFLTFNVFLHDPAEFSAYLRRLRLQSQHLPLILGEIGMDTLRQGPDAQARLLAEQIPLARRCGFAGTVVFSFTDEWHTGGRTVPDWAFGVVTAQREAKPGWESLRQAWLEPPKPAPDSTGENPRVSVIVCAHNAQDTLPACLESLQRLSYSSREIILVDDGSADGTAQIAQRYPEVRLVRQAHAGLSAARNRGAQEADGEILAYTDADCVVEPDWLDHLVEAFLGNPQYALMGGPNVPPPPGDPEQRALSYAPGGPCEVMLTDTEAEHLPGCNLAMWRWVFDRLQGFDPMFRAAGDDVDFCWRAADEGLRLGFAPRALVWHPRRKTLAQYRRQQKGYGRAEGLLQSKHPHRFNDLGITRWQGMIYGSPAPREIYGGRFGLASFPAIYSAAETRVFRRSFPLDVGLAVLGMVLLLFGFAVISLLLLMPALVLFLLGRREDHRDTPPSRDPDPENARRERKTWRAARDIQQTSRNWARRLGRVSRRNFLPSHIRLHAGRPTRRHHYWSAAPVDRAAFLQGLGHHLRRRCLNHRPDDGRQTWDYAVRVNAAMELRLFTLVEMQKEGFVLRTRFEPRFAPTRLLLLFLAGAAVCLMLVPFSRAGLWMTAGLGLGLLLGVWYLFLTLFRGCSELSAVLDELGREFSLHRLHPAEDEQDGA